MIANLHSEFRNNLALLTQLKSKHQQISQSTYLLLSFMGLPKSEIMHHNPDSILSAAIDVKGFRPPQNAISEIFGSGKLNLISSDSLKSALFEWVAGMEEKDDAFETMDQMLQDMFLPYLVKNASLKNIDRYGLLSWKENTRLKSNNLKLHQDIEI